MGTNGITKTRHTIGIHWDKEQRIRTARVAVEGHLKKNPKMGGKLWEVWKNWWKIWSQNPGKSEKNVLIWHKTVSLKLKRCVDWKSWSRRSENPTQSRKKGSQPKSSSHKKRGFVHMIYIYYRYIYASTWDLVFWNSTVIAMPLPHGSFHTWYPTFIQNGTAGPKKKNCRILG